MSKGTVPTGETLTLPVCWEAEALFIREGLEEASSLYRAAGEDIRQAFLAWYAAKGDPPAPSDDDLPAMALVIRNMPDADIPEHYSRYSAEPSILVHEAFQSLARPLFVIGHETVHLRNPGIDEEMAVCRLHVVDLPPRAQEVITLCRFFETQGDRKTLREIAQGAGMDPGTLNYYRRHPFVDQMVRGVLPVSMEDRLARALVEEEEESASTSEPISRASIARRAGVTEKTVVRDPAFARRVADAVEASQERWRASVLLKIASAVESLKAQWAVFSIAEVARQAGYTLDFFYNVKAWASAFYDFVSEAADKSLFRAIEHVFDEAEQDGREIYQKALAEALNVSESAITGYKQFPEVGDLIRNRQALSAVVRIRNAISALVAEGISPIQDTVAERAGVHQSTVSRAMAGDVEIAKSIISAPREYRYPDETVVLARLAERQAMYGSETCNTAKALAKPLAQGGDGTLLEACRRMNIALPRAVRAVPAERYWLIVYLNRMAETKPLSGAEAAELWDKAHAGDAEGLEALVVGLRPMVRFVIEQDLREETDPEGFKAALLEHLIRRGDEIIIDTCHSGEVQGAVLSCFRRALFEGLSVARKDFYIERSARFKRTRSLDAPMTEDGLTLADTKEFAAGGLSPDKVSEILDLSSVEEEAAEAAILVARRDEALGVQVIRVQDKAAVASALGTLLVKNGLGTIFSHGVEHRWAIFMGGSMGRLGSALAGNAAVEFLVLSDATRLFAEEAQKLIQGLICASSDVRVLLTRFGVALPSVFAKNVVRCAALGESERDAIDGMPEEELLFQVQANGILVAESGANEGRSLIRDLLRRLEKMPPEDAARGILDARDAFLIRQREAMQDSRSAQTQERR